MTARNWKQLASTIVSLAMGCLATACSGSFTQEETRAAAPSQERNIPVVEAVQARYGSVQLSERLNGTVIAQNQVALFPEMSGRIIRVQPRNGDSVRKGEPLVYLQDAQYRQQLGQAQASFRVSQAALEQAGAQLEELQARYRAIRTLADEGLASRLEVETLEAQIASAKARIELTEAQIQQSQSAIDEANTILAKTVVRAPITGTIGGRNAEVGMQVDSNTQLFTIGDLSQLRVEVVFTEEMLNTVKRGQAVRIVSGPNVLEARLSRISPFLDPVTRTTVGEADVRNEGNLKPGMSVRVEIVHGQSQQATLIPTSALYTDPSTGQDGVFLLPSFAGDPEPERRSAQEAGPKGLAPISAPTPVAYLPVEVMAEGRMEMAVTQIQPGSWIVTVGQDLISDGTAEHARVRATNWERVLTLQRLQREDLLREVLETD